MDNKNLVINLNKPKGLTSQQAVTKVKKLFAARKAGHAGTLDPLATGILLVCLNEATKITRFLAEADKEYLAMMKLGERTDTLDSEGKIIYKAPHFSVDKNLIETILERFRGNIEQIPPMYSAIKVAGKPLYRLARKGIEIERQHRSVNIYALDIAGFAPPFLEIRVLCSKGTYIRTLCDDIGTALGIGAHVVELKRTKIGDFIFKDSADFDKLPNKEKAVCSIDASLSHLKDVILTSRDFIKMANGAMITSENLPELPADSYLRLKNPDGKLFAIGKSTGSGIKIERLLHIL
ncbi:MAG: tRNA pseudouridine(55) synthase TruB [Nitrospirae bacterium GWF2_44_13]|nr:MAG: tRNA pseudouridine(55) synthase TruB [Nitrospirae bacterium GWF2_44_13]OGW33124.1 MAG: tRNA pseudouridine(55) synthase TruB [Nitrospirae bacterium GWD2_44_7]OGW65269.1 MAG: tRNA pseudouridine(55) synthase TruB [Nitrospirae bacterium RIFOXYA2_FULL_44_9]OGW71339.1 MAG: tRNA pseudouridine(55) synthase TruB [Nitrospirae bacterium RIFOXYC2_FULL_44_7]HBG93400.1 tRNA pseudouridine(55) synthase TruB [Nitrospiraceae bacterium]